MPDNTPIDGEIERSGGFGRFQYFILVTTVLGIMSMNLLTHGIAVLELEPVEPGGYLCVYPGETEKVPCTPEDWCDKDDVQYEVNYEGNEENLYNWATSLTLVCRPKSATARIGMICAIGIFLGVLFIPRLGDLYGRKPIFFSSMILSIPVLAVVAFANNLILLYVFVFFAGPAIIARMSCGFLMLMEHATRPN